MNVRRALAAASAGALALSLSGCAGLEVFGVGETTSTTCVSWVSFEDAQAAYDEASLVVVGVPAESRRSVELVSGAAEVHHIAVEQVIKGEFEGELDAAAPRDYCVAEPPQPAEDPIASGERLVLLLNEYGAVWSGLTPEWTALPLPEGAELPFDTGE